MNDADESGLAIATDWPSPAVCVVRPTGVLDAVTSPGFARHLGERAAAGPEHLVLDLAGVRLLAAAGVAVVVDAQCGRRGIRGRLHLTGVTGNRPVERVLELTGVRAVVDVHDEIGVLLARLVTQ